ncbi:hypothetical protein H5410_030228 [Solanum commersonii]|uniref:2-oxoglutarate-dependent dioxygenase n=1 Tax=Solanum commersonii TaxID=4109 RepID=A0A9J5YF48_SOLCO|nr:hypothetical protein H5410_030228 [Solanum commersonii]
MSCILIIGIISTTEKNQCRNMSCILIIGIISTVRGFLTTPFSPLSPTDTPLKPTIKKPKFPCFISTHSSRFNTQMTLSKFDPNDDILYFVIKKANGIKGVVYRSLEIIPNQCIQPKEHRLDKSQIDNQESIPTIDLSFFFNDLNWSCFQIINHGIPIEVLEDLKYAAHKIFELPAKEKVKYCKASCSAGESVLMFWSAIGEKNEKYLEWRDNIKYEVLLKGLNVNEINESLEPLLMGTMNININYYPPCSNPSITIGSRRHCDVSCITLLFQDEMGALYCVAIDSSRARISVPLFVNTCLDGVIGPIPQMLKDGEKPVYKNVLHSDYWVYFYCKRPSCIASLDFVKI